jgi:hypothetical protein
MLIGFMVFYLRTLIDGEGLRWGLKEWSPFVAGYIHPDMSDPQFHHELYQKLEEMRNKKQIQVLG